MSIRTKFTLLIGILSLAAALGIAVFSYKFSVDKDTALTLFVLGTGGVVFLMLIIWVFFSRQVLTPLKMIEERATGISLGKDLEEPVSVKSKDEIGVLARAIDRLRISMDKMLKRSDQK